ncbi:hypothetical protein JCM8097_002551 [Rhodosporidiobolus ruineniae]
MQPFTPYSFAPLGAHNHLNASNTADPAASNAAASDPSPFLPGGPYSGASNPMLIDSGAGASVFGDALNTAFDHSSFPSLQQHLTASSQHHSQHPGSPSSFADSPTHLTGEFDADRRHSDQMETDMLQSSGLATYDGQPASPTFGAYGGAFGMSDAFGQGGAGPARSLSYTAGDAYGGFSGGGGTSMNGGGTGINGGGFARPTFGRAETIAAPPGSSSQADPFARLRAGHISITPSVASPASGVSPAAQNRANGGPSRSTSSPGGSLAMHPSGSANGSALPLASIQPTVQSVQAPYPSYSVANPVYDLYGSSYTAAKHPPGPIIQPHSSPPRPQRRQSFHPPASASAPAPAARPPTSAPAPVVNPAAFSNNPTGPSDAFDPHALGLPIPPPRANDGATTSNTYQNIYSATGFDLVGVLARVVNRKNPTIEIGAIDMSCSFVVVDAKRFDQPIVYASETFSKLTGYQNEDIVGRNCRFLQAPGDQLVTQGEKRRYTDGNAAFHLRKHIVRGEETQVSLINYHKGGKPFINLVTCIPISWTPDSGEIDFFVGFQVDLVDQPAAILDKMQNGSYIVNYSAVMATVNRNPPSLASGTDLASAIDHLEDAAQHAAQHAATNTVVKTGAASSAVQQAKEQLRVAEPSEIVDLVTTSKAGFSSLANEALKKQFFRLLVDNSDDLIHVVSLKGALLYVSAATRALLEYEPSELLGKPLASFCHPSDIVSVQRELKDAGVNAHPSVELVYRIRRKHSGYMWMQSFGRLHLEPGKGRKCVILSGRPREVYRMSWRDLELEGGMTSRPQDEFWAKICLDGIYLLATQSAEKVLGLKKGTVDIVGRSIGDLSPPGSDDADRVMEALHDAAAGNPSKVQHRLVSGNGAFVEVVTRFYPCRSEDADGHQQNQRELVTAPQQAQLAVGGKSVAIIAQVSAVTSEAARAKKREQNVAAVAAAQPATVASSVAAQPPSTVGTVESSAVSALGASTTGTASTAATSEAHAATTACASSAGVAISAPLVAAVIPGTGPPGLTSFSAVPSTFKSLTTPSSVSDNVFDELNVTRGTSWQFELHQMRLTNKKLREEREALDMIRKKKLAAAKQPPTPAAAATPASANGKGGAGGQRSCANCGRTSSAEWRSGPTGPKTLCNACGLRWSKSKSQAAAAEKKRKEAEERAATVAAAAAAAKGAAEVKGEPSPPRSEAQSRSNSRDSGLNGSGSGSGGDSTDPTTVSPSPALPSFQQSPCAGNGDSSQPPSLNGSPMAMYPHPPAMVRPTVPFGIGVPPPQIAPQRPPLIHNPSSLHFSYGPGVAQPPPHPHLHHQPPPAPPPY